MIKANPEILDTILASPDLPTLPTVAAKLLTLIAQEETSLAEIAQLVAQDMALAAKILRVANSSLYSFPQEITTIRQAVAVLGSNAVQGLVLSFSLLLLRGKKISKFNHSQFWERSLAGAAAAKVIARQIPGANQDEVFIAGLLQNIGELIFAATIPEQYDDFLARIDPAQGEFDQESLEQHDLGITHSQAGFKVAEKWGLPQLHRQVIISHHRPRACVEQDERLTTTVKIVYLADLLAKVLYSEIPGAAYLKYARQAKELFAFKALANETVLNEAKGEINTAAEYFGLNIPPTRSVEEILQEANLNLGRLTLSYEELNLKLQEHQRQLEKLTGELQQKNVLLENLANQDFLTEVANHRQFQSSLDKELNRSTRQGEIVSLLLMDLDRFKDVNDTHGHLAGDVVLKEFCMITRNILRDYDLLARYGGEEFATILPATTPEKACIIAQKIRAQTEKHLFQGDIRITVSIGVASARPAYTPVKKFEFIKWADEALYQAKNSGRNRVACHRAARKAS